MKNALFLSKGEIVKRHLLLILVLTMAAVMAFGGTAMAQNSAPIANAGEDQNIYLGDIAQLHGTAIDPDGDPIVSWFWTLELKPPESTATLSRADTPDPYFVPDFVGDYYVRLTVSDGFTQSEPDWLIVHVAENLPPVAVIITDVTTGPAPLTVNFDGTQSSDPEGRPLSYSWNFRDGSPLSADSAPTHEYFSPGTYVALLVVTDDRGQTDSDTIVITVTSSNNPPVVAPTATPNSGYAPLLVQFSANASDPDGDALSVSWDFGDGYGSNEFDPAHTYTSAGTYVAWVTASDGQLEATDSVTIVVDPGISMTVQSAEVKYKGPHSASGSVELTATVDMDMPSGSDVISLSVDGIELFTAPFSSFEQASNDPNVYKLRDKDLFVQLDLYEGTITVIRRKLDLSVLDNSNGVDVMLNAGSKSAVENVVLIEGNGNKLEYHYAP